MPPSTEAMKRLHPPYPLRKHQEDALARLAQAIAPGASRQARAWVVLPPGMGKTLVGLEAARRLSDPAVVLTPNTAIQGQWLREWAAFTPDTDTGTTTGTPVQEALAGTDRDLSTPVTVLTYQSLASFDPDAEIDEDGAAATHPATQHLRRLRPRGLELVEALRHTGKFTLLLDECHHLLDTWGELVAELLRELPDATVIGLTATPPDRLTPPQAELVAELFGPAVKGPSIPAAVREGHLAPYAELCWVTTPTPVEADWLAGEAERFTELTTGLLDPDFASRPFLSWLDERFVARKGPDGAQLPWSRLARDRPELTAAALRFHHAGLLALPDGARPREEHRRTPGADDWVRLLDDWVRHCLRHSDAPRDAEVLQVLKAALPSVGHQLTARGIRGGRSPVDRVLARSASKPHAVREILAAEDASLGDRLRAVVVCDHERATATLPARLTGVLQAQAGSALLVLEELAADPRTAALDPLLVTGRTVAASPQTARSLISFCRDAAPELTLSTVPLKEGEAGRAGGAQSADALVAVVGATGWSSRRWVALATRFFEQGGTRALIGTRGMLGEGWDARRVNTLIDLTEATTATAVVQTRGRALRLDPDHPHKVANTWSVVCVADAHPRGDGDWNRFVRKHDGYLGLTDAGEVMVGVSHVHPELSPYEPPPTGEFDRLNATMLQRAASREEVRARWRIGDPYEDDLVHTLRVTVPRGSGAADTAAPPPGDGRAPGAVPAPRGVLPVRLPSGPVLSRTAVAGALATAAPLTALPWPLALTVGGLTAGAAYAATRVTAARHHLVRTAASPVLVHIAWATADALHVAGVVPRGSAAVSFEPDETGAYRVELEGVPPSASAEFAAAFDEAVSPLASPRYVIPRYVLPPPSAGDALRALCRKPAPNLVVHHAVPSVLAENRRLAGVFSDAWNTFVSAGAALYTRSPEGAGVLAGQAGGSPLEVTTAMRVTWR